MKRILLILLFAVLSLTVFGGGIIVSVSAGGPVDKVTGDVIYLDGRNGWEWECEFSAHERNDSRSQKGLIYCSRIFPPETKEFEIPSGGIWP